MLRKMVRKGSERFNFLSGTALQMASLPCRWNVDDTLCLRAPLMYSSVR
jgi:hypothetical protein